MNSLIVVMNDGAYGSEMRRFRSVFGYCDFTGSARGFGLAGKTVKSLEDSPKRVQGFAASGGAAVWDVHVSDKVVSATICRAHPPAKERA